MELVKLVLVMGEQFEEQDPEWLNKTSRVEKYVEACCTRDNLEAALTEPITNEPEEPHRRISPIVNTVTGTSAISSRSTSVDVVAVDRSENIHTDNALLVPRIPLEISEYSIAKQADKWILLRRIPFKEIKAKKATLLIRCDVPEALWAEDQRIGNLGKPYAMRTPPGWVMFGPCKTVGSENSSINYLSSKRLSLTEKIRHMYDNAFYDFSSPGDVRSVEDQNALYMAENCMFTPDHHFEMLAPRRSHPTDRPNNYTMG
ncbi:hypothetical protein FGIG_00181 [Fasciola gigantica]|uniref:Uncharacterized protein n=1 Tax=Fasciola gigantica TaxID=46835 RepID=A0A504Y7K6_FASGI|nr:hypothetical protein FGIG_00181 [Fasciola gigantica]